ncbi:Sll0314/Alr1548 family TPR repeat-containing protein [Cyanobacterium sp. uoEpiScrs1]|uniref:Sll0314/Alr1548 family TPR repeat-containing protein n=1 Tax=Cyanobacterium sp. uoEpiScrs1 TaxID=2976343 RepID=UPI00226A1ABA|nr:Sll0314/Alr1548 family TPR repeat-containing protein [Cyanobacterium sp. uoEpiScrs1]
MIARFIKVQQMYLSISMACTAILNIWGGPSFAGDPFRKDDSRNIGDQTEAAFIAVFHEGNYSKAQAYLEEAVKKEVNEPLAHAMQASLAYSNGDLGSMNTHAQQTLKAARRLIEEDPLRGNLYLAVGHFLEGAYTFKVKGAIGAVNKLPQVFSYLDEAEKQDPNDPELNLLKGYLDLILAVNLPFSSPEDAIIRFERYAAPDYMVSRAISAAYRDLKDYDKALRSIDRALESNTNNPEVQYLKGQILLNIGIKNQDSENLQEAFTYFERAMIRIEQLPVSVQTSLRHDYNKVQLEMDKLATKLN